MKLWIAFEAQEDVGEDLHQARAKIEPRVNARLASDYGPAIQKWALISIVRPRIPKGWGEVWQYDADERVAEFRLIIDHHEFKSAAPPKQLSMLLASIFRSLDLFPLLNVTGFDVSRFRRDIEAAALSEGLIVQDTDGNDRPSPPYVR